MREKPVRSMMNGTTSKKKLKTRQAQRRCAAVAICTNERMPLLACPELGNCVGRLILSCDVEWRNIKYERVFSNFDSE
jgi:hypothetical protein